MSAVYLMDGELPKNATEYERALASQVERLLALQMPIRYLWNPDKCPIEFLPYLAWSLSVDVWDPSWPEHRKRTAVAHALRHHGIKGTLASFEDYAELVDSKVLRAITPPGRLILSGGLTEDERLSLAERMPQIRIYTRSERSRSYGRLYLSARKYSILGAERALADSRAIDRTKPRIALSEGGREAPIEIEKVIAVLPGLGRAFHERALLRRPRRKGVSYFGKVPKFLTTLDSNRSVASFIRSASSPNTMIRYGLKPATIQPEIFYAQGSSKRTLFMGKRPRRRFFGGTNPESRVYERIIIWDPNLIPRRRSASYLGVSRFGMKPFTAELVVSIPGKRAARAFSPGHRGFIGKYFVRASDKKYSETLKALRAAKSVRDTVLVNTKTFRPPTAGQLIVAGTPFIAGRLLRS